MGDTDTPTLELFVRSLSADAGTSVVGEALARLDRLAAADEIDGYEVTVWGDGVSLDDRILATNAARSIHDRIEELRAWADATDRDLPGFETHTTRSAMTGEVHRNLTVPTVALAERQDGEITWVAPCRDDTSHTVTERLEDLLDGPDRGHHEPFAIEAD